MGNILSEFELLGKAGIFQCISIFSRRLCCNQMIKSVILKSHFTPYNWDPHSWTPSRKWWVCVSTVKLTSGIMSSTRTECQCSSSSKLPSMRASGEGKLARNLKRKEVNTLFHLAQYHDFYQRLSGLALLTPVTLSLHSFYPKNWRAAFILILQSIQSSLILSNIFYLTLVLLLLCTEFSFFLKIFSS